ncbi:GGDEF-domain containing protein [Arcobacter suis]|uniref:Diguanylate cyclase/phosphodiesterase n=1 Tax=Arcobacter suis CECT 7833 TaxID=663365 RepID=A0AAD0SQJ2_9BACT|nr:bifunctional diguanylate cyclase/phosphodiesterase [Arcobacter suis]AXX89858.1 diguanylate cyclase/phosphodiesterase [Arcobacter suis CECT 7833]RWS46422.1 GGDEF-domain containing protein [Arcobacter suis]
MRYDVLIISDEQQQFKDFKKYASKIMKNINITLSFECDDIHDAIEYTDILIIDINVHNYFNPLEDYLEKKIHTIFLIDDSLHLEKYSIIEENNILYKPLDLDKLILKIKHYTNLVHTNIVLKKEEEFSNSIINNIDYPIFSIDSEKVIFSNDHFFKLLNCSSLEEINSKYKNIADIFEKESGCITNFDNKIFEKCENKNIKVCINSNNVKKYFSLQKIALTHNNTSIIILHDISHEIEHKHELYKLLYTDNLTAFPNRAKLIEELQTNNLVLEAVCLLNINSFKEVNDFFGHKVGDAILIDVAKLIQEKIKNEGEHFKLYKFPSDNYCITNTKDCQESFINLIKNILESVYKKVFVYELYEIDIRITAGISFSNKNNKLITADIALQSAKKDHKDYIVFYDELDKFREYENNMLWTKKLKSAFINDNIEVYFQPLVNNRTLKVDKYECLVRLIEEDGKVVAPYFFLDISKKSNQYTKLTKIVLEKSFQKFENLPFEFSVNISYEDIENPDFLDFIKELLNKYNVTNRVVFEILEDESIKNYNLLISFVDEVKALGCKVAIDDFGSGYSNFEHLLKMNIDYLKIDASLIKNIATNENSYKITKTIIEFAKNLNLKTIAEFVENEEIFNIVRKLGADYSQGYFFSAPISAPNVIEYNENGEKNNE